MSSSCVYPPDPERLAVSTVGSQSPGPASAALPSGTPSLSTPQLRAVIRLLPVITSLLWALQKLRIQILLPSFAFIQCCLEPRDSSNVCFALSWLNTFSFSFHERSLSKSADLRP